MSSCTTVSLDRMDLPVPIVAGDLIHMESQVSARPVLLSHHSRATLGSSCWASHMHCGGDWPQARCSRTDLDTNSRGTPDICSPL